MAPILNDDDRVLVDCNASGVRSGDVVLVEDVDGRHVLHRIAWIDWMGNLWQCGDAPGCVPSVVRPEKILGKALSGVRGERWFDLPRDERSKLMRCALVIHGVVRRCYQQLTQHFV